MCGLKAEEERDDDGDDDDDKRGPVTALIPHQEAVEECHKAADMSLRQPTSTLDRYDPHIHYKPDCFCGSGYISTPCSKM